MNALRSMPLQSQLGLLALLGSGALLGGALLFQYVGGLPPCDLCMLQRYPHVVAIVAGAAALAAWRSPRIGFPLVMVAVAALLATSAIGVFHAGVEYHWWKGPQECTGTVPPNLSMEELKRYLFSAKMVRCDETAWSMLGISMAGWNAIISAGLALVLAMGVARGVRK
jgi:disulfide bond formation protein DsbB